MTKLVTKPNHVIDYSKADKPDRIVTWLVMKFWKCMTKTLCEKATQQLHAIVFFAFTQSIMHVMHKRFVSKVAKLKLITFENLERKYRSKTILLFMMTTRVAHLRPAAYRATWGLHESWVWLQFVSHVLFENETHMFTIVCSRPSIKCVSFLKKNRRYCTTIDSFSSNDILEHCSEDFQA